MTHLTPPPEPPPIVQTLPPEDFHPALSSGPSKFATQPVITNTISSPTLPESVESKPSKLSAAKSAELLGAPISVGYPVEQVETKNGADNSAGADAALTSSIQPLRVSGVSTTSTIAKLKKLAANRSFESTAADVLHASRSIQPLKVSDVSTTSTIAKLKKFTASETTIGQIKPSPSVIQPAPSNETQPATSQYPAEEQRQPVVQPAPAPVPTQPQNQPSEQSQPPSTRERIIELTADRQEYDEQRQIVTAEGNVLLRFDRTVLDADRLQVNLSNLIAVGEGNVALTTGEQVLRGQRFTYNFIQDSGEFLNGRGEIYLPTAGNDFSGTLPTDVAAGGVTPQTPSDRLLANQPLQQVTSTGGITITARSRTNISSISLPQQSGEVRQLRFEAEGIDFYPGGWQARNVRITNDPFSPPELELRANTVTLTRETPLRDRIRTTGQRLVFDQGLSVPIPKDQAVIDRTQREPSSGGIASIGYDGDDRGGLYVERTFSPIDTQQVRVSLTPQFFAQQAVTENGGNVFDPALYGLKARLDANLGLRTSVRGSANFTNLDFTDIEDNLRASLRLRQRIGDRLPHTLTLEYSYRDRLYNGSLGYRTVQSSVGGVFTSPVIPLGKTGLNLSYQASAQYVTADTDQPDLWEPDALLENNRRVSLSRLQGTAALSRGFSLWQGRALPATATEGLRYTPAPVVPYVQLYAGVSGTSSFYGNGDNQTLLTGTVGLQGQFGHFSRPFLDYTGFNISYSQGIRSGESPFLFDRDVDTKVLTAGLTQQIYGPLRLGVQTSLSLDTGESYSTDYILEYSRRTYGITLRYNPQLELGSLNLRISDFNWAGGTDLFSGSEVEPVVDGVRRVND